MKIYQLWSDHTYRAFETAEKDGYQTYHFEGIPVENQTPLELYPSKHSSESKLPIGDVCPVEISAVVVNEKCFKVLCPYIKDCAQVFQTKGNGQNLYVLNIIAVIDCLDRENAELKLFKSSGRIMRIEKYVFYEDKIKDAFIFKLPEELKSQPYVTEQFKQLIEKNDIRGFKFVPVWDSEE